MSQQQASRLLEWYAANRRPLPWRSTREPYRIWVSEVMLQQTQASTVVPYYRRFTQRYPTLTALAEADVSEVLTLWSGLGYYRRARSLHAAARQIICSGGEIPTTVVELRRLPGIGEYTAAAIASQAFGVSVPAVDGNVMRVTARFAALVTDPRLAAGRRQVREVASSLLSLEAPGESNQALMELGATVCRPGRPLCGRCPLASACRGRAAGDPERFSPARRQRSRIRRQLTCAVAIRSAGESGSRSARVLLYQRAADSPLLAGTWEVPMVASSTEPGELESSLAAAYGGEWRLGARRGTVHHSITYRDLEIEVREAWLSESERRRTGRQRSPPGSWFDVERLPARSSLVQKVLKVVVEAD